MKGYYITGPGTGNGMIVSPTLTGGDHKWIYRLKGIPAGTHTWSIAANYEPGGVLTRAGDWPEATTTVGSDPAPRYRLVALGFMAHQQSKEIDDARDGHGDEVYFSAIVNRTRLTGVPMPVTSGANLTTVMTRSHGDEAVSVPYGRIRAGTASATGGIRSGDAVPANLDPAALTGALQTLTFPIVVWEGELADGEVVIVHPMLWEDDVNPVVQALWSKRIFDAAVSGYVNYPKQDLGNIFDDGVVTDFTAKRISELNAASLSSPFVTNVSNSLEPGGQPGNEVFSCTVAAVNAWRRPCEAHGVDRPIGLEAYNNNGFVPWHDVLIFLSKASLEGALTGGQYVPYMLWPRGTFSLKLRDQVSSRSLDVEAVASYDLFFRIERVR